ncbi:MAG: flavodoxin family protein [Bdellovibrionales bacterium]
MKKALFLYYSQTGQTARAMNLLAKGFSQVAECDTAVYTVSEKFAFPWKMTAFFRAFPRCVLGLAPQLVDLPVDLEKYDLIILGGQVWFLSPSLPLQAFFQSDRAQAVRGKKIISVITCRNIWYSALNTLRAAVEKLGGKFLGQITICEISPIWASFVTTPRWMLTGKKEPFAFFPAAGIREEDFAQLEAKGRQMATSWLNSNEQTVSPDLLKSNLDRPSIRLMNKLGFPVFKFWASLIMRVAPQPGLWQDFCLILFRINLIILIVVLAPYTKVVEVLLGRNSTAFQQ